MMQSQPARVQPSPCDKPLTYVSENLSVYHAHEGPNVGEAHAHDDVQISLPLSGAYRADWQTATGRARQSAMSPGALLLCAPQQPHGIQVAQGTELAAFWLPPSFLRRTAEELGVPGAAEFKDTGGVKDLLLQHLCLVFLNEVRQQKPARLYVDTMANLMAVHLTRRHGAWERAAAEPTGRLSPRHLKLVLCHVEAHLDQDISLADLSGAVGLSPSHFCRLFKRSTGQSPHQYVIIQRVERAKTLLMRGGLTVGDVSQVVGFSDQSQFQRHFKKLTGLTPGQFRGGH